ncbi:helicase-related protein [Kordiimonas aquimaris]|uniref:helicase-related protein n=1 Tax=Kordiimonas aquimaris TaxID=707591 RepID=UPI0021D08B55|nr:helicase-related protein [Kordiimonas aquimaris]
MTGIIKAVLGPTNTGKTHYAVDRMIGYASGMMGFPLRLLAREVYDKVVAIKGKNQVALITGEERIVPEGARYFMCTAEAMPRIANTDFVAIDEIQMAADPQRGHIFTEHLLHSRGRHETLLLGAETMAPLIRRLIPEAEIIRRERFSLLTHTQPVKLSRLPRRSVVVGFSANNVYAMAELMRRQKGGAAIVMGALSPRTRNAQVELYQSGEVDHLVATDAIGMGLNMDITHVAFSGLGKFDGRRFRDLRASEAAQIAGRAGRYKRDGTFSTVGGESEAMDPMMVAQIEDHQFEPVKAIYWRNHRLDFTSIPRLLRSLEAPTTTEGLHRAREAIDMQALKSLSADEAVEALTTNKEAVERLWNVCQIPDFRKLSPEDHFGVLKRIYIDLMGPSGSIPHDWIARQVKRLDNVHGDIDTLAGRIASIRVWTYVSHRKNWLDDAAHWAHVTRSVEDRLSDALHEKLTQRFVDRRTAVLMRSLRQRGALSVSIDNDTNQVSVEGHEIGELNGFSFRVEPGAARDDAKMLKAAAETALQSELTRKAKLFANVGWKAVTFDFADGLASPKLLWEGAPIATVYGTGAFMAPRVKLLSTTLLNDEMAELVRMKAQDWLDQRIAEKLEPLVKLAQELNGEIEPPEGAEPLSGLVRGVAFRLMENFGVLARKDVDSELRQIDQDARRGLRRFGIRIGATSLYMPLVLKPHANEMRLMMWAMAGDRTALPSIPTPGMVWVDTEEAAPAEFYQMSGFQVVGKKAVRMDMLERLADAVRPLGSERNWFEVTPEIMGLVGLSGEAFADTMRGIGYKNELREIDPVSATEAPAESSTSDPLSSDEKAASAEEETIAASEPEGSKAVADDKAGTAEIIEKPDTEAVDKVESAESDEPAKVERYFFMWAPARLARQQRARPEQSRSKAGKQGEAKPGGKPANRNTRNQKPRGKGRSQGPRVHSARPPKREQKMDPDSPFAALAGLKDALSSKK